MKSAVVVGSEGQDGRLLFDSLKARGLRLAGLGRGRARGVKGALRPVDVLAPRQVEAFIGRFKPDEVYFLAAFHHSAEDAPLDPIELFRRSSDIHLRALVHFLEAISRRRPSCRLFYASSSHVFGASSRKPLDESAPLRPADVYGLTKAAGMLACRYYRQQRGVFASTGIFFNHESALRRPGFVSRKIVQGAVAIKRGRARELVLGDLSARVDWGYAPDYVEAMQAILRHERPDDFVVASGRTHSVKDFAAAAFSELGLNWKDWVRTDPLLLTKKRVALLGDPGKLRRRTGWRPRTSFEGMVRALVRAELAR